MWLLKFFKKNSISVAQNLESIIQTQIASVTGSGSAPPSSGQASSPASSQSSEANNQRNSPSLEDQLNSNAQVGYLLDSRIEIIKKGWKINVVVN